jgi:hypothetical protein
MQFLKASMTKLWIEHLMFVPSYPFFCKLLMGEFNILFNRIGPKNKFPEKEEMKKLEYEANIRSMYMSYYTSKFASVRENLFVR